MVSTPEVLRRGLARLIEARVRREILEMREQPEPRMWSLSPGKIRIAQQRLIQLSFPEISEQKPVQGGVDDRS